MHEIYDHYFQRYSSLKLLGQSKLKLKKQQIKHQKHFEQIESDILEQKDTDFVNEFYFLY